MTWIEPVLRFYPLFVITYLVYPHIDLTVSDSEDDIEDNEAESEDEMEDPREDETDNESSYDGEDEMHSEAEDEYVGEIEDEVEIFDVTTSEDTEQKTIELNEVLKDLFWHIVSSILAILKGFLISAIIQWGIFWLVRRPAESLS